MADSRQQDVAARLVGLGLDGKTHGIAAVEHVGAQSVDGLLHAVEGGPHVLAGVRLGALPAPPGDVGLRPKFSCQVDVAQCLAQGIAADAAVVGGEGPLLEHRVGEQVGGHHLNDHAGLVKGGPEALDNGLPLGVARTERDQVVVVEGHAPGAQLRKPVHGHHWVERCARGIPEGVPALPSHRPQPEAEVVLAFRCKAVVHGILLL